MFQCRMCPVPWSMCILHTNLCTKFSQFWNHMWCDLWKPVTCRKRWNCKIKEINIIILMFFFIFDSLWTSVTFDTIITGDPSKKFWKENNSNFYMISITQNINFAPCDGFSQITSQLLHWHKNRSQQLEKSCGHVLHSQMTMTLWK